VIAALQQADVSLVRALVRQGVADVAELPFAAADLTSQILDSLSKFTEFLPPDDLGQLVTVVRASGGCGATSVLTHLAEALARQQPGSRGVCLLDLDIQGGDVASFLGIEPAVTIEALIEAGARLDRELVRNAVTETRYGFNIIAAPRAIAPVDKLNVDHMLSIVREVRSIFDYVLVDLPAAWTDWSLSVVHGSDRILMLTDTSISGLRQAKRRLELLEGIAVPHDRVEIVVNRLERKLFRTVSAGEVGEVLGCAVVASLSSEGATLRGAQDQGVLLAESAGKTRFGSEIETLAKQIVAGKDS
jgi:pilus assembly protein CpaE